MQPNNDVILSGAAKLNYDFKRLTDRMRGVKSRCGKPPYQSIKFEFPSAVHAAFYCLHNLGPLPEGATIDRIDPRGNYSRGNIRYASKLEQSVNRVVVLEGWRRRNFVKATHCTIDSEGSTSGKGS